MHGTPPIVIEAEQVDLEDVSTRPPEVFGSGSFPFNRVKTMAYPPNAPSPHPPGTREHKIWYLKRSKMFERATDQTIGKVEDLFTETFRPAGTQLFEEGDIGRLVYLVKAGKVRISRRNPEGVDSTIAILGQRDIFGEEIAFADSNRTITAATIEDSIICTARAEDVYGLFVRHPLVAINVAKYISEQRNQAFALIQDLATLSAAERIEHLLDRLTMDFGIESDDGTLIDIRLTHADIASLVGTTRETVTVTLRKIMKEKNIERRGRRFFVRKRVEAAV